ncbi:MAG: DUF4230 domain-containing protein [Eggerthellaceae bacterium]
MAEDKSKISIALSKRVKFLIGGLLVGFVLGVSGVLLVQSSIFDKQSDEESAANAVSVVFSRIVEQNELVSVSQDYSIVKKATDVARFFDWFDIDPTRNSFWYRYAGTIKAGVNLGEADMTTNGSTIIVSLSEPYIISNTPDMEVTGVLEENNNILNPIEVKDVDAIQADCRARSEEEAIAGGLLDEAREQTEKNIRSLFFAALGDSYAVEFEWKSNSAEKGNQ